MSMGKSKGGMAPDSTCEEEEDILKDMAHLIAEYHDPSRSGSQLYMHDHPYLAWV